MSLTFEVPEDDAEFLAWFTDSSISQVSMGAAFMGWNASKVLIFNKLNKDRTALTQELINDKVSLDPDVLD